VRRVTVVTYDELSRSPRAVVARILGAPAAAVFGPETLDLDRGRPYHERWERLGSTPSGRVYRTIMERRHGRLAARLGFRFRPPVL